MIAVLVQPNFAHGQEQDFAGQVAPLVDWGVPCAEDFEEVFGETDIKILILGISERYFFYLDFNKRSFMWMEKDKLISWINLISYLLFFSLFFIVLSLIK